MGELAIEIKGLLQEMVEKTALTLVPNKWLHYLKLVMIRLPKSVYLLDFLPQ
jgi:hypothetical protein